MRHRVVKLAGFVLLWGGLLAALWWVRQERLPARAGAGVPARTAVAQAAEAEAPAAVSRDDEPLTQRATGAGDAPFENRGAGGQGGAAPGAGAVKSGPRQPLPAVQPRVQRLPAEIEAGRVVERREWALGREGDFRRVTVFETAFKHPWLRLEEEGKRTAAGVEVLTRQTVLVADHLLVKLRQGVDGTALRAYAATLGGRIDRHIPGTPFYTVQLRSASIEGFDQALAAVAKSPGLLVYAEPDRVATSRGDPLYPDDPSFSLQWPLHNTGQAGGKAGADIRAPEAWGWSTGSEQVVVAVIDTGMDLNHPDLAPNLWTNPGETGEGTQTGIDDDGNGYVDDLHGWNFYGDTASPQDDHGHGTHTAGTVGAVGGNGVGVSGVVHSVRIMPLKFLNAEGSGTDFDAMAAIHYATEKGVLLSSNSWSGVGESANQPLYDIIQMAGEAGVGFVAAAGNESGSNDEFPSYPSSYTLSNIISVAATDASDELAGFSNFGAGSVDLAAPGAAVYSTYRDGGYAYMSGTSMATPHVAGACALLKSANPALTFAQIKAMVLARVQELPSLAGKTRTGGRLDLARALVPATGPLPEAAGLTVDDDPARAASGNGDGVASPGESVQLIIPVRNAGAYAASDVQGVLSLPGAPAGIALTGTAGSYGEIAAWETAEGTPFGISIDAGVAPADVALRLSLTDGAGKTWDLDLTLRVRLVGTLAGVVTKLTGGEPLAGATITISGPETHTLTTAADGSYAAVVTNGTYTVQARAAGYIPAAAEALTVPPSRLDVNFVLGYSQGVVAPASLTVSLSEGQESTQTLLLTNQGDQDLTFEIRELPADEAAPLAPLSLGADVPAQSGQEWLSQLPAAPKTLGARPRTRDASDNWATVLPFADSFEDGMWGRWWSTGGGSLCEVVGDTAGQGLKSFHCRANASADGHFTGVHQIFDWGVRPGYIGFRIRPGEVDQATAYLVLLDSYLVFDANGLHEEIADFIWFFANANGRFYLNGDVGGNQAVAYSPGQWYQVEFRRIDWTAKTFNYWVNGQLVQEGVPFRNPEYAWGLAYAVAYNYSAGADGWWDDFRFQEDELPWLRLSQVQGTIPPGGSATIETAFDARALLAGEYTGSLLIRTNDPASPEQTVPLTLSVAATPNQVPEAQSQALALGWNETRTITLGGSDGDGDALTCKIVGLPSRGALYQTADGVTLGRQITNTPTVVSHAQRKVIFRPATDESGSSYASFDFVLRDAKADSAPAAVTLDVAAWPLLTVVPAGSSDDQPVNVTFQVSHPSALVRLTTDGTEPVDGSRTLAPGGSLLVERSLTLRAQAVLGSIVSPVQTMEFQIADVNANGLPDWWEAEHAGLGVASPSLSPDADSDGDGLTNAEEFVAGTAPDGRDGFQATVAEAPGAPGEAPSVSWPSRTNRLYRVESSTDLRTWQTVAGPLAGTGGVMSYTEGSGSGGGEVRFYRVRVSLP